MKVGPGMPVTPVPEDGGMGPPQGKPEAKKPAEKKNEQK